MAFGITLQGFKAKRLADIQEETTQAFRDKFGEGFDLDPRTPEGQIKGILDEAESKIWELAEAVSRAYVPIYAEGAQVDNILALSGIVRKVATFSKIDSGRAFGVFGTLIPAGTIISVSGDDTVQFSTDLDATIDQAAVNEVQKLAFSITPTGGSFKIVFEGETTAAIPFSASAAGVQSALEALSNVGVGNVSVSGAIDDTTGLTITFIGTLGGSNRDQISITENVLTAATTITPSTFTQGSKAKTGLINLTATQSGPLAAPTGSLTVIETPVVGLEDFTNEEDAELGRNIETDQEAKLRRELELELSGSSTRNAIRAQILELDDVTAVVVFSNRLSIFDIDGRPPHSVDIVVQGGDEDVIAQTIFDVVADGIGFFGDITKTVIDSQGFGNEVKFSRPVEVDIWIEVDVTKNPALFPVDGADQIKQKILDWGNSRTIGQDVIVFGSDPLSCSFDDVPGMIDLVFRVGTSASPTNDDNVAIAARELAKFDSARILVTVL